MLTDLQDDSARSPNRLAGEPSAYLRQHAFNPVDWHPWGPEALERARREDRPIFLSIGYSACHWCHVMEHESFMNPDIAALLNQHFVAIKVDREERPDLDELYMAAVQMLTGRGGWPMSVFLTPDLKPFFGGTYFPPETRHGLIGFGELLRRIREAWTVQRPEIARSAEEIAEAVAQYAAAVPKAASLSEAPLEKAAAQLERAFDPAFGGFGPAPKFPPSAAVSLLLRLGRRLERPALQHMALFTLNRMAAGGLRDQLGGGFHRYSVDEEWRVPHFEKMLYDQALIAPGLLEAGQATGDAAYAECARQLFDYVLRELSVEGPDGAGLGFCASEDADSEGGEGFFYTWAPEEVVEVLGADEGALFCTAYGVRPGGDHEGRSVLHRPVEAGAFARWPGAGEGDHRSSAARLAAARARLLARRAARPRPGRDGKIITAWNGLMIAALAQGAFVLNEPRYLSAASNAAETLWAPFAREGILYRLHYGGGHRQPGFLDDYAFLLHGLVELAMAGAPLENLRRAALLAAAMLERFGVGTAEPLRYTAEDGGAPIARSCPKQDGAEPSGNSIAVLALNRLGRLLGRSDFVERSMRLAESLCSVAEESPRAALALLGAADELLHPGPEVVVIGSPEDPQVARLREVLRTIHLPGSVRLLPESAGDASLPLLRDRSPGLAYVCREGTCLLPADGPEQLRKQLSGWP